jgi:hypothetical protein
MPESAALELAAFLRQHTRLRVAVEVTVQAISNAVHSP